MYHANGKQRVTAGNNGHLTRAVDQEKMGVALQRLSEEDPTFKVYTHEDTGQTIIAGMGELHLEIIRDRMLREFKVDANAGKPQIDDIAARESSRAA